MSKVLFVKASPVKHENHKEVNSLSLMAINIFKEEYKRKNPKDKIIDLDLNAEKDIHKVLNGDNITSFWDDGISTRFIKQLNEVDKVVVVTPTHNWNYSTLLKQYFDLVVVARKTFFYNKWGIPVGMLKGKKVQLIFTQGSPTFIFTKHVKSAKKNFKHMGMKVVKTIHIGSLNMPKNITKSVEERVNKYKNKIERKARKF